MLPVEVVQKQVEFFNNHDIEGFVSTYSKDIQLFTQGETKPYLVGSDALYEKYSKLFLKEDLHVTITNRMELGNCVIDFEEAVGLRENEIFKAIAIYQVENDLIQNVWFVKD
ncbi:nuclear transport factor 2 family protein [Wukongibacter baidiensis]|uniref:nuclear transport factor 2 family protein n=1 Tax=Wukongibacter baidiensis TaxID=1723361 RepID=UPI003D7FDF2F